jgi:hypothetical protein
VCEGDNCRAIVVRVRNASDEHGRAVTGWQLEDNAARFLSAFVAYKPSGMTDRTRGNVIGETNEAQAVIGWLFNPTARLAGALERRTNAIAGKE